MNVLPYLGSELEAAGSGASPLIFYANRDSIRYISTRNVSVQGVLISGLNEVRSLALYVRPGWIFWSEYGSTTTINRMRLSAGATKQKILDGLGEVHDIAVEWESALIYWTDYLHETIEVARIDGSYRKTLFWENVANPRAIVVDSRNGYMYWSETGWDYPRIERATLAGTERTIIMEEHPGIIPKLLINGLVIDFSSNLLYWVDAQTDIVERMKLDQTNNAETVHTTTSQNLYSYGLTLYEDILYASELRSRSIERINVTAGEHLRNMGWLTEKMTYRIALNSSSREPSGMADCQTDSKCTHLCLLTPTGFQCACSNGFKLLPDNVTCNATGQPPKPPVAAIEVRLMFGNAPSILEGRIEVRMKGQPNEWGTVCDDHFDMRDAQVVCRMLNHSGAEFVGYYGSGSDDSRIWLDNLKCRGDEDSLMECKHRGWGQTNCGHFEDVGVKCKNDSAPTPPVVAPNMTKGLPANITIQLRGGPTKHEGFVEITHDGKVGTICDNDFDIKDAHVICRMLGFEGAWSTMCCGRYGTGTGEIWLDNLQCLGNETSLSECPHLGWGNYNGVCTHARDAGVYCIPKPVIPPDNIIRLVEGTSENEGRVEIFHKDRWGTICDDGWDLKDANVICRMLNYSGALAAPIISAYDVGSGQIWLDEVNCLGNESSIYDCPHGGWGNHDCSHLQDAGVICQTNESALPSYDSKKSLLFSEHWRGIIFQVNLEGDDHRAAPLPIDHLRGVSAVGFDPIEELVYFAEYGPGIIQRSHLNGSNAETIVNGIYYANRLAIDHLTRNIYFTDSSKYRIDVATLDGKHRTGLISTVWPEGLALDLKNGHIYWASQGFPPTIERADLDGNNQQVIITLTEDSYPSGLTVDYDLNRLYWTDRGVFEVYYIDLQTRQNYAFITREIIDPIDLAIHHDTVYVTDLGSGDAWDGGIYSSQLAGPGNFSQQNSNISKVIDLMRYTWGIDSYDKDNIFHTGRYHRLILHTECYFSEIYKSPLGADDLFSVANTLPLENVACPSAIASHSAMEKIYWTDLTMKHIARSNLDGTDEEVIVQNVSYSVAIAVDSYAGNIYFTDRDKKTVEVAKLDGKFRTVLIQSQTHDLVGLAIDTQRGYMYYSAWGNPPMINRAQLDGSDITPIVEFNEFPYQRPTALAIDVDENVLYWVGDQDPSLQYIDLRYPKSEIVYHINYSNYLHYPLGLALDAHYFYWTDWLLGNVIRASRGPKSVVVQLIPYQYTPRGVNIFNPDDVQDYHPCVEECGHLCLLKPGGYKCACTAETVTPCVESINITNVFGCTDDPSIYFIDDHHIKCFHLDSTNKTYVNPKTVKDDVIKGASTIARTVSQIETLRNNKWYMFWTDYGFDHPRIERADLTGENRKIVVEFGVDWYSQIFPMSVIIEYNTDTIYWIDRYDNYIDRADLDGRNKGTLKFIGHNINPADLALYGVNFYWVDRNSRSIEYFNKTESRGLHYNFGHLTDDTPAGVVVSDESRQPVASPMNRPPCRINNGGCSHLCLLAPSGGSKCACPNGVQLEADSRTCSNDLKVRLSGSDSSNEGRVEVYHQGRWGTVCDDHWGMSEATVLCKMLNFSGAIRVESFGPGNYSFPILMDNVKCRGDENSIAACQHNGWEVEDCSHSEDVGVVCRNDSIPPTEGPTLDPGPHPELQVKLRSGPSSNQGRVELYLNNTWGTICDDNWGIEEANVICRMLGFSEGAWSTHCCGWYDRFSVPDQIWLDNVHCVGDETSIAECRHGGWGSHNCLHSEDVGVVCKYTPLPRPDQILRLADGVRDGEGRVEIFHAGHWGTICDDFWDTRDAQVVCGQLGYSEAIAAPRYATFGEGNGHVWLEADDFLLFCEGRRKLCYFMPLPQEAPAQTMPLKLGLIFTPAAISYDPLYEQMYWTDEYGRIFRAFIKNGSTESLVTGIGNPQGIAFDLVGRNIYFADYYGDNIRIASLDGVLQAVLVDVSSPQAIALDSASGVMYYSSLGSNPMISQADMDGKNQQIIANLSSITYDTFLDLVMDKPNKRLFFSDQTNDVIKYIDLNNLTVHTILSGNLHKPTGLTLFEDTLYWTATGEGQFSGVVFKANLSDGEVAKAQAQTDGLGEPKGIYAHNSNASQIPVQSPCENNGGCSQLCVVNPNGKTCMCKAGMVPGEDGTSCTLGDVIFVADSDDHKIYYSELTESILAPLPISNTDTPTGIAFDPFEKRIYWTDPKLGIVARSTFDGKMYEVIRANVSSPTGIAVDLVGGNVFWINSGERTIEVSKLDGDHWKVLVYNLHSSPVDIALDTTRGYMYWSAEGYIERAELDGLNRRIISHLGETYYGSKIDAMGLALDDEVNRLYFVSYYEYALMYIDLDSSSHTVQVMLRNFFFFYFPYGVAVDDQYVYFNEYGFLGMVFRVNKNDTTVELLLSGLGYSRGLAVKKGNYTRDSDNPCDGSCSHLCLVKPGGYKCACPADDGNTQCTESEHVTNFHGCESDNSLYFIDRHNIKCIELKSVNSTYANIKTVRSDLILGGAIDIDYRGRMIYWSDNSLWTLNRMSLTSGEKEIIIRDNLGQIDGLAVEWESGLIYWTDFIYERIEVAKLDGSSRRTLISDKIFSPRGIAVDPMSGYLFWTDIGFDHPRIERLDLNGENRQNVVTFGFFETEPMSVIVDYETETIHWVDRYYHVFQQADKNGSTVVSTAYIGQNINPADLALLGDLIYWADRNSRSIEWFNKTQKLSMHYNLGHLTDEYPTGVVVSDKSRQPVAPESPCRLHNGGCSHLCLIAPSGVRKCACPAGVKLEDDNMTCSDDVIPKPPPMPVPVVKVRLSGSGSSHEGRVEVYHQGRWGTVCDDHWGMSEATVLCKMLNFSGAIRVEYFGPGDYSFPILMDNVKCRGDENSIAACQHNGWGIEDCSHSEDAGVVCSNDSAPPTEGPTLSPGPHPELKVRLRSGITSNQGRVELFLNGTWGTICDDYWGIEEANVICRMLGYAEGAWSTHCCGWYDRYSTPNQIWLDDVHCDGDEDSITECRHGGWGSHNCLHSDDVGVVCKYTPLPRPGQILRLADGIRDGEGRVEIFHDGHWGTVCDDSWDKKDADVVCRQLGYREAINAPTRALFGEGNGHIWLAHVNCSGDESSIEDCQHVGWNVHGYCFHEEDASVICSNETRSPDADDFLLFCEDDRKLCHFQPLPAPNSHAQPIYLKITLNSEPIAIAYDPQEKQMYWTDYNRAIRRASIHNGMDEVVLSDFILTSIQIDTVGRNMYFADYYSGNIRVASLDGTYQAVLIDVEFPQGIALDSESRYIYYVSHGYVTTTINRADMDGENQMAIATMPFIISYIHIDLALDKVNKRLYFSDRTHDKIHYVNLDNKEVRSFISGNLQYPRGLTLINNTLYWTSSGDGKFTGAVFKANITDNPVAQEMVVDLTNPSAIYAHNSMISSGEARCQNNGGCEQLCLVAPNGQTCRCRSGMVFSDDGKTCTLGDVILVADIGSRKIFYSELTKDIPTPIPVPEGKSPVGIAFDPFKKRIYWTDSALGIIARSKFDGKMYEVIRNVSSPTAIDLDLVGGNLFWINSAEDTIEVSNLDGDNWKVLISDPKPSLQDIVLDTKRGYMYWSALGFIEGAELDGSNRTTVALGNSSYGSPLDALYITLDVTSNRIYFVSYDEFAMFYIDLSSGNHSVHMILQDFFLFFHPRGIAVDDQYVYWGESYWYSAVLRVNKTYHYDISYEVSRLSDPGEIVVKKGRYEQETIHPCSKNSCTHLCFKIPSGYKCDCPNVTSDGQPCTPSVVVWPPPPTTAPTTTKPPPTTTEPDYCASAPCKNGASCKSSVDKKFHCSCVGYFGGLTCSVPIEEETVQIVITGVTVEKFNLTAFIVSIVNLLNDECAKNPDSCLFGESTSSIVKRAVGDGPFKPEDIYIPSRPKEVDGGIQVEYAVVKTSDEGKPVPVPASFVADVTEKKAAEIGRSVGGTVTSVKQKPVIKATSTPQSGRSNAGVIAGVVVGLCLVLIIAALAVRYFRMKRTGRLNLPYVKEVDEDESKRRTTAFENPGYDSAGIGEYDDINPVVFSPFQETTEASGVSNPIYSELGMTKVTSSEDVNKDEANGESADPRYASPGELPKKEPLPDDKEAKPEYVEILVQGDAYKQEEPRYALPFGKEKGAKNDQTAIEMEKEEDRYQTLTGNDAWRTAAVLEDNKEPNDQTQS
ncbi:Low-density lipoprotein receptor-related protein 6 [Stylophora pistillata]|uniref:Low-density lipoprotein receptor-related protein 6 n=1 Tax=Stylophora pistillata TaxID=50429 RepID=A0A2B4SE07_STYPI|nr:Low-density lipoprotein receptor-related protein 6 [Stylophora pistillata]